MCGIAGFLERGQLSNGAARSAQRMADAITHRGPDDSGVWTDEQAGVALSHRRLAIIDLSQAGHQPMLSHSGRYAIVYNGEIYNFAELRAELDRQDSTIGWRGESDTEVLLAAIDAWGVVETLKRLNGMFAFALWDRHTRVLTLARDRIGEKPLFYGTSGGRFLFGSELKALQAHPGFRAEPDANAIAAMLRYDYVPAPRSVWMGISKLEAAHYLQVAEGGRPLGPPTPYWSFEECARRGSEDQRPAAPQLENDLDALLRDAVAKRMIADVPLGAFLSGGIDSSLIVALMQAQSARKVRTFTIGFAETEFNEAPKAAAVASHLGTEHTELYVSPQDALDLVPKLPEFWDEPFGDSSQIPTCLLAQLTRESVTVALSGDGGDELFGGYDRYRAIQRVWGNLGRVPKAVRMAAAMPLNIGSHRGHVAGPLGRAGRFLAMPSIEALYRSRMSHVDRPASLVHGATDDGEEILGDVGFLTAPVEKMMYLDTPTYLAEDILTKVDRATMAFSLEARAPFLDHRVVEFAWTVPPSEKLSGGSTKRIMRKLGARYLPPAILDQAKMGFSVPLNQWLRGPLRDWAEGLLDERRMKAEEIFEVAAVRGLWAGLLAGKRRHDRPLWNILMVQAWLENQRALVAASGD